MNQHSAHNLFHARTLNQALHNFEFPPDLDAQHKKIQPWIATLQSGTLDEIKETSLHGEFLRDIFQDILGYRSAIQGSGQNWEIHAEQTISAGGGSADGALGFFTAVIGKKGAVKLQGQIVAPIELKGAKNDLDRPAPGRKESAVDQGWRYANYTADCKWVIVSNYRELRLYQTSKTPAYYERFRLQELEDPARFQCFYFLLCRRNFLPPTSQPQTASRIDNLLKQSNEAELDITQQLYSEYKQVRIDLARHFRSHGPKSLPDRDTVLIGQAQKVLDRDAVLIAQAQKVLDRILFVAFCEDKGLLPDKTIVDAHDYKDPYHPRPIWENYKAVFRWVNCGNDDPPIPGYNGGLFKPDPLLDEQLQVTDRLCSDLKQLAHFDFDTEVSVDILGRIFEQSVTDLEELRALTRGEDYDPKKGKRKTQGVYYTPAFITQYIVQVALGGYLERREQALRDQFQVDQISAQTTKKRRDAEIQFLETYRDEVLLKTRVIDPACGAGAFLIAAFDFLMQQYERVKQSLAALSLTGQKGSKRTTDFVGQRSVFDLDKTILNTNLYGVDLSSESVEMTKLSLWLKTAEQGKTPTYLDNNIKVGNSIIADPTLDRRAFAWEAEFPDVFADGGFDVVIGNPPYVRQELLSSIKPYLQKHYASYDGVADLYTYFYERGLTLLKPEGILSYIVSNKWLRAGYGEPLRRFLAQHSIFEQIVDFGHAPIFEDADTFPCIVSLRKPAVPQPTVPQPTENSPTENSPTENSPTENSPTENSPTENSPTEENQPNAKPEPTFPVLICSVPREQLAEINLPQYIQQESYTVPWSRFTADAWSLEHPAVEQLMQKIQAGGIPIQDFVGVNPLFGIKTGFNEAFLVDRTTKNRLLQEDPAAAEILKPCLKGRNIRRWRPEWDNLWIVLLKSSSDFAWKWSHLDDTAEEIFHQTFPSIYRHLKSFEHKLRQRQDRGQYWWELRPCAYYEVFEQPKIITQDLATYPWFCVDDSKRYAVNTCYVWPTQDLYALGWLCSPIIWWFCHRTLQRSINGTLRMFREQVVELPIAPPTDEIRAQVEATVSRLIVLTQGNQSDCREVLDWLRLEHGVEKPGQKLSDFASLDEDSFVKEVKKRRPKGASLRPKGVKAVREAYDDYVPGIQSRRAEVLQLEHRLSELVNRAYGLTPEEVELMWKTAPPRMPIQKRVDEQGSC